MRGPHTRGLLRPLLGGALVLVLGAVSTLATEPNLPMPRESKRNAKDKEEGPPILPPDYPGDLCPAVPVCLLDVLRLAALANLDIAQANIAVERARVAVLRAQSAYLPNLNLGSTYTAHDGTIQRTEGTVIQANRDSLFVGLGTSFNVNLADAFFLPAEAQRLLEAARIGQIRVTNDTLLRVADAYFEVLRARRRLARLDETLDFLTSEKESELRGGSKGLLPLIRAFVKSGTALPSDQARVEADVVRRQEERVRAMQDVRTASAELARLLHMNALVFLLPREDFRWPLDIPGHLWCKQPIDSLVTQALSSRPELGENAALIEAAVTRYRAAKWRPLVPSLVLNYSYGGFGGGPEVIGERDGRTLLGNSGVIADFGSRSDLELGLIWRLQGFGLGNKAQIRDARLRIDQAHVRQLFLQDLVVAQVVQASEQVKRGFERVAIIRAGLFDENNQPTGAIYRSLRLNFIRIRGGQGLPLEVLDSTRRLSDVLEGYANALTDYDRARFRLLVALGLPPAVLLDPSRIPVPPGCIPEKNVNSTTHQQINNRTSKEKDKKKIDPAKEEKPPVGLDQKADTPRNGGATIVPGRKVDRRTGEATPPSTSPLALPPPQRLPDDGLQFVPVARPKK